MIKNIEMIQSIFFKAYKVFFTVLVLSIIIVDKRIKYFSPLNDKEVPISDYIYIGGGFPEIFAKEIELNKSMRESIRNAHEKNIPIYAECGGLMYLGEKLVDQNENEYDMVGILKGTSKMTKSLRRFGYCYGIAKEDTILSNVGEVIKGHEFHHSVFESEEECAYIMKKERDKKIVDEWEGGYSKGNTLATYLHTHFYNNLNCIEKFLGKHQNDLNKEKLLVKEEN